MTTTPDALTPQQRRAVDADARALEIRAGAGTGKTTTLAHRVARFGEDAHAARRLLVVTFTRDATATLARRLSILLGRDHGARVHSFHQWAARELPSHERTFLGDGEQRRILQRAMGGAAQSLRRVLGASEENDDVVARIASLISYVKNRETTMAEAVTGPFAHLAPWEHALTAAHEAYEARKGDKMDFDDLLLRFRDKLQRSTSFRREVTDRIDHLFVDEYQDVNRVQDDIVHLVASPRGRVNVTVVGDARQSIYGFRGGAPDHLDAFLKPYGRRGKRVALTLNFRSSRALVASGNDVLPDENALRPRPHAPRGEPVRVWPCVDPSDEARRVADRVESLLRAGEDPAEIVVLARSRFLLAPLVDELRARVADDAWAERDPAALTAATEAYLAAKPRAPLARWLPRAGPHERAARVLARRAEAAALPLIPKPRDLLALRDAAPLQEVSLSTIHAAKGLEWNHVILVGAREGGLPSEQTLRAPESIRDPLLAEERRLLYVAVTRARESFVATWSPFGRRSEPSRFLAPLTAPAPTKPAATPPTTAAVA